MRLISFCFFLMISFCSLAQSQFMKTIVPTDHTLDQYSFVRPTTDNGFTTLGHNSMVLLKFNECAELQWGNQYGSITGIHFDYNFTDMVDTKDYYYVLSRDLINNKCVVTKIDPYSGGASGKGAVVWDIQYTDNTFDHVPYAIKEDHDGNIILFANISIPGTSYNLLVKIRPNGTIMWSKKYHLGVTWGDCMITSDNGVLFRTGRNIVKVDENGNVQWSSTLTFNGYYYYEPVEVADGYILNSFSSIDQRVILHKIDKNGNEVLRVKSSQQSLAPLLKLRQKTNGNFVQIVNVGGAVINNTMSIELDKDFNIVSQKVITHPFLYTHSSCILNDNSTIILGREVAGSVPFVGRFQQDIESSCDSTISLFDFDTIAIEINAQNVVVSDHSLTAQNTLLAKWRDINVQDSLLCSADIPYSFVLGNDTTICENTPFTISPQIDYLANSYLWSTGETTSSISVNQSGTYWLEITVNCGKDTLRDSIDVMTYEPAYFSLGEDRKTCLNENFLISLDAPPCDNCSFLWSDGNSSSTTSINTEGTYWLQVTNENGCITTDSIDVICDCSYTLPNIFTPNEDHINDSFLNGMGTHYEQFEIQLYNRWGRLIYSSEEVTDKLNLSDGTYYYNLTYTDYCTQTNTEKGWVEIRK